MPGPCQAPRPPCWLAHPHHLDRHRLAAVGHGLVDLRVGAGTRRRRSCRARQDGGVGRRGAAVSCWQVRRSPGACRRARPAPCHSRPSRGGTGSRPACGGFRCLRGLGAGGWGMGEWRHRGTKNTHARWHLHPSKRRPAPPFLHNKPAGVAPRAQHAQRTRGVDAPLVQRLQAGGARGAGHKAVAAAPPAARDVQHVAPGAAVAVAAAAAAATAPQLTLVPLLQVLLGRGLKRGQRGAAARLRAGVGGACGGGRRLQVRLRAAGARPTG